MNSLTKIVKESGINFSGSLLGVGLGYIWLAIITRLLTPDEFGTFTLSQSIINVAMIFVLIGTPKALDRFIPYFNAMNEAGKVKMLIITILKFVLILSTIISLILFLGSDFLSIKVFNNTTLSKVLRIVVLSIPLLAFIEVISASFRGFKELRYQVYFKQLTLPVLKIVLTLGLFLFGLGLFCWIWSYIISLIGTTILAFWFFKTRILDKYSRVNPQSFSLKKIFSYSWPLSINNIILILLAQIDYIILGVFRPSSEIGVYRIYTSVAIIIPLVLSSIAQIYKPIISEKVSLGRKNEIEDIYKRVSKWIFLFNIPSFLIIIIYGPNLIRVLFTRAYLIAPVVLSILALGKMINSSVGPIGMTLEAFGNTRFLMLNSIIMLIVNTALDYLLIPDYGIVGAAIATAAALMIVSIVALIENYLIHNLFPFTINHIKYILIGAIIGFSFHISKIYWKLDNVFILVLNIVVLFCIYIIVINHFGCFDETDRSIFKKIRERISN